MRLFALLFFMLLSCAGAEALVDSTYTVIDIQGNAEASTPNTGLWKRLEPGMRLPPGTKIRTGADSWVDLAADVFYENMLRIGENSYAAILNAVPMRLSLDQGSLFALKEENAYLDDDPEKTPEIRILTRDFLAVLKQGGCKIESGPEGVMLKAFAESMRILPKAESGYSEVPFIVEEGFRYSTQGWERMEYPDYIEWQIWYKKNNERKDKLARSSR